MTYRKKLIEVALPLEAINNASMHEKTVKIGKPTSVHHWWARRPLAACRAVLFASLVDDPSSLPEQFPTEAAQEAERQRLFSIIEDLVKWENSNNEAVLQKARAEIMRSTNGNPPPVLDPFAGGGSIPLEAQRLGLEAHANDLNPVAVLINKALIEIPPKFADQPPVNPESCKKIGNSENWKDAQGLAEDVRYYGRWIRDEAEKRIGHLYPKVKLPKEYGGGEATVIAWLWARTVQCPNPACGAQMPLVRSFMLSAKKGKQAWVDPIVDRIEKTVRYEIRLGTGTPQDGTVNRRGSRCIVCSTPVSLDHVRFEGKAGRMNTQMMAIVAEGQYGRLYLPASIQGGTILLQDLAEQVLETDLPIQALGFRIQNYGMTKHRDLFTSRQLVALTAFSDLVSEARKQVLVDALTADLPDKNVALYANAIVTYLAMALDRAADWNSSLSRWENKVQVPQQVFGRQAISMVWDFAESNILSQSTGSYLASVNNTYRSILSLPKNTNKLHGVAQQLDATSSNSTMKHVLISTDPPYYDAVPYADLSDFFYVWLRRTMRDIYPDLFKTLLVPKDAELVADPFRRGGQTEAQVYFEQGLGKFFQRVRNIQHPDFPFSVFYAFKQAESDEDDDAANNSSTIASTGWETMLEGLVGANLQINGTWPVRTEMSSRMRGQNSNALASSIVLVCRPRPENAPIATRREFVAALRRELPDALRKLQHGNIAPVDLAQAAIGPGMAVFSRYSKVVESNGEPMRVRTALQLINQALDEVLAEQEGEYDSDTRWAIDWFSQYGANEGPYGVAETLSKAKNTSISGLAESGILHARSGKVQLLRRDQLSEQWNPTEDRRRSVWEITQHLIRALEQGGEYGAAGILVQLGSDGEAARDLAYRLYTTCERKGWAQEALAYNSLVVAWPSIVEQKTSQPGVVGQTRLDF